MNFVSSLKIKNFYANNVLASIYEFVYGCLARLKWTGL